VSVSLRLSDETPEESVYVSTTTGQTFRCSRIVLAIPPTSLRTIEFSPNLPPVKKFLVDRMNMGATIKFYATYDEPYWCHCYKSFFLLH
jgi:monoamine oxidase